MSSWTNEEKELAVAVYTQILENDYETDEQRAENSTAIVERVKEHLPGKTVNGIRLILRKADVYIAQTPKASASANKAKTGGTKMSKADQIQALKDVIRDNTPEGTEIDEEVFNKLTGKAAAHLTELFIATAGE